jgi:hypothetical protein
MTPKTNSLIDPELKKEFDDMRAFLETVENLKQ